MKSTPAVRLAELDLKPRKRRRRLVWALLGAVAAGGAAAWFTLAGQNQTPLDQRYKFHTLAPGEFRLTVTATGNLEALNTVDVGSELSGKILSVNATFNDQVSKGQILAVLDPEQNRARVAQAEAARDQASAGVRQAEATLVESRLKLERSERLAKNGMIAAQELDLAKAAHARAEAALALAQAQVKSAQQALEVEQTNLRKTNIIAPIDGVVINRTIEPGQTVAASFQTPNLFRLAANLKEMEVRVLVSEADIGRVRPGMPASFTVDAYPGRKFESKVLSVRNTPKVNQGAVSYEAVMRAANPELLLRPGMTATATLEAEALSKVLTVPNAALRFSPDEPQKSMSRPPAKLETLGRGKGRLWIKRDAAITQVEVDVGATDSGHTVISGDGVKAGDQVAYEKVETAK